MSKTNMVAVSVGVATPGSAQQLETLNALMHAGLKITAVEEDRIYVIKSVQRIDGADAEAFACKIVAKALKWRGVIAQCYSYGLVGS